MVKTVSATAEVLVAVMLRGTSSAQTLAVAPVLVVIVDGAGVAALSMGDAPSSAVVYVILPLLGNSVLVAPTMRPSASKAMGLPSETRVSR